MRKRIAKALRNWAYKLDPPAKPGRKRKVKAEPPESPLLDGWATVPDSDLVLRNRPHDGISGAGLRQ